MNSDQPEQHRFSERRLRSDRRLGLDRRIAERRVQFQWVEVERRMSLDRRRGEQRRNPLPRRSWINRRGSGPGFTDLFPS